MIFSSCFEDEITVWWDKDDTLPRDAQYRVSGVGAAPVQTQHTHATFRALPADTSFLARIDVLLPGEKMPRLYGTLHVRTEAHRATVDVSAAPYFAPGDGVTLETAVLQSAIDACPPGGRVLIPSGVHLTGALFLHSDMELFVAEGAVLQGTTDREDYLPMIPSRFEGYERMCYASLINVGEMDHTKGPTTARVSIRGGGRIVGGGRVLAEAEILAESKNIPDFCFHPDGSLIYTNDLVKYYVTRARGRLIHIANAEDVTLSGVSFEMGSAWTVHFIYSRRVLMYNCEVHSENVYNGDGFDPDSSTDSAVFGCVFNTGDDSVAIKSGKNPEGNIIARPTSNIRVFDISCSGGHGICVGSEMSGGVDGVYIWDCDLSRSVYGVELKGTAKRAGFIRNVRVSDVRMPRFMMHSVGYNDDGDSAAHAPLFSDCTVRGCTFTGEAVPVIRHYADEREHGSDVFAVAPLEICGFSEEGHEIENVSIERCTLLRRSDGTVGAPIFSRVRHLSVSDLFVE